MGCVCVVGCAIGHTAWELCLRTGQGRGDRSAQKRQTHALPALPPSVRGREASTGTFKELLLQLILVRAP